MSEALEQARRRLEADGVRFLQIEASELDGALRGKLVAVSKGLGDDVGFCTTLLTSTTADGRDAAVSVLCQHPAPNERHPRRKRKPSLIVRRPLPSEQPPR